ncbi:MAG TPA: SMP-30/gluconolactonase/LRE family protein [Planctomycetota bacterium]|nr:SMP-30/gluconolactonase/LRE family protein [Planctomycetota bacterium]
MEPELIADYQCDCGENPLWHPQEKRLYWEDIPKGRLFRYDPATGHHEICYEGDVVGGFTFQADGALLLFMAKGAIKSWRDGKLATLYDSLPDEERNRFNDVTADPQGRVFCGTMSPPHRLGRLYRLDTDGSIHLVEEGIGVSNGMGFTLDRKRMYHTDTRTRSIYLYDYDEATGALANRRVWLKVPEGQGGPDGMTVDAEGHVWDARWDGGVLVRLAPDGTEVLRIPFPARKVSSVVFGGDDYSDIYVTTAGGGNKATDGQGAGALFRLRLGIRGLPEFPSRIRL